MGRGYNMLHYAAECVEDASVVELLGLLASNVDQRDDNGMRPIDYARQVKHQNVEKMLERLRKMQRSQQTKGDGKDVDDEKSAGDQDNSALQELLAGLQGLSPELKQVLEKVVKVGWGNIGWPSNFTAMHLAAKCGHVGAVDLLVSAKADLGA